MQFQFNRYFFQPVHTKECIISAGLRRIIQHKGGEDTKEAESGSEQVVMLNKKNESKIFQTDFSLKTGFLFFCLFPYFVFKCLYISRY